MVQNTNETIFADEKFCHIFYASVMETLGECDFKNLLDSFGLDEFDYNRPSFKPITVFQLKGFIDAMLSKYGMQSTQGVSFLVGKSFFRNLRQASKEIQDIGKIQRRLEQFSIRLYSGLRDLIELLQMHMEVPMQVIESPQEWQVQFKGDVIMRPDDGNLAFSFFLKGMIQEFLQWIESQRPFKIEEFISETPTQFNRGLKISVLPLD